MFDSVQRTSVFAVVCISAGCVLAACTLTSDDFRPQTLIAIQAGDPPEPNQGNDDAGPPPPCSAPRGCCVSDAECSEGESCSAEGTCELSSCASGEDLGACEVALCPGPGCPEGAAPSCDDGERNQAETDVDCGGDCERRCADGEGCATAADCEPSRVCPLATRVCTDASCVDGMLGGAEVLIDCGGGECPGCPPGSPCASDADCSSGNCGGDGECNPPSCNDDVQNQNELGVDCGGPCQQGCPVGSPCSEANDCNSDVCGVAGCAPGLQSCCQPASCSDGEENGDESDVDCGGADPACARCADGADCQGDGDCESGNCAQGSCVSCSDGDENGNETDVDCGGNDPGCPRCPDGADCEGPGDCIANQCNAGSCGGPACNDGALNGAETDVDCGGPDPLCARCAPGDTCQVDQDCVTPVGTAGPACVAGRCCGGTTTDCTRCAERLSTSVDCDLPQAGVDPIGVDNCRRVLQCFADNLNACATSSAPGCSGDDLATNACPHNSFGGNAGTGFVRARQVLANAQCQL